MQPSLRIAVKRSVQAISLAAMFLPALFCGFGRVAVLFNLLAQLVAIFPGVAGNFLRAAFYKLTAENCSIDVVIAFGTFFSRRQVVIGPNVSIGSFCVVGPAHIGARTQIASHVEIPGGRTQHSRDENGRLSDTLDSGSFVSIGEDCWIGAASIVMADIGSQSTIGAGSVVVKDIPSGVLAVGSPARVVKSSLVSAVGVAV